MKVLFVADDAPVNRFIIAAIEARHTVTGVLRPDWKAPRPPRDASAPSTRSSLPLRERVARRLRSRYFATFDALAQRRLARDLFPEGVPSTSFGAAVTMVSAWEINAPSTAAWIRAMEPDLMVVSGAPILRSNIYRVPRLGTINVHFGISPAYRGMHTLVTPWQRGDYTQVGATVHYINDGIDAGPALLRVYPTIRSTDDLASVEANIVRGVAAALSEFLTWLQDHRAAAPAGRVFPPTGQLIRFHDRQIRDHVLFRLRHSLGARPPLLPERIETFYR